MKIMDVKNYKQLYQKSASLEIGLGESNVLGEKELDDAMLKLRVELDEEWKKSMKLIKAYLMPFQNEVDQVLVNNWRDADKLDILHYSIISNRPDVMNYMFKHGFFSSRHVPVTNPYAHLAAFIGHKECLHSILLHRPNDFFKTSEPHHRVRLPGYVMRRLNMQDSSCMSKKMEKLLEKIKDDTKTAEMKTDSSRSEKGSITERLEKELDTQFKQKSKKPGNIAKNKIQSPAMIQQKKTQAAPSKKEKQVEVTKKSVVGTEDFEHMKTKLKRFSGKHLITIYRDVFMDYPQGVIGGAGKPVDVVYTKRKSRAFNSLNMPSINDSTSPMERKATFVLPASLRIRKQDKKDRSSLKHGRQSRKSTFQGQEHRQRHSSNELRKRSESSEAAHKSSTQKNRQSDPSKKLQIGVRSHKKYKEFHLSVDRKSSETRDTSFMNKTPLTFAAERGNMECVHLLLEMVVLKQNPIVPTAEPLTLATKGRSPESILLLIDKRISRTDFQSAVLIAIRELFPDCLSALLSTKSKERNALFDGINLYHILYSQSLVSDYRYEMMAEMTRVLINSGEDVNAHSIPQTFPMYTLINCAFRINIGKMIHYYLECLELLLSAGASPHYNEIRFEHRSGSADTFSRQAYSSAISCIVQSAKNSVDFFPNKYWPKLFLKKFVITVVTKDLSPRKVLNDALFCYMSGVCDLGLDRLILRFLLRYGANPDFKVNSHYAINVYFDLMLPYLTRFQVSRAYSWFKDELETLMIIACAMSHKCQREAVSIFLEDNLLNTPLQALPLVRYFSYLMNRAQMTPRPLTQIAAQIIWLRLRRNEKKARLLPVPEYIISLIVP